VLTSLIGEKMKRLGLRKLMYFEKFLRPWFLRMQMIAAILIVFVVLMCLCYTHVNAQPPLPHAFFGAIIINGNPAPAGTSVKATGNGVDSTSANPLVTTDIGMYGSANPFVQKLIVRGYIDEGAKLTFYVNDVVADQTAEWYSGELTELDLTVTILPSKSYNNNKNQTQDKTKIREEKNVETK